MEELLLAAFNYQGKKSKRQRARATNGKVALSICLKTEMVEYRSKRVVFQQINPCLFHVCIMTSFF